MKLGLNSMSLWFGMIMVPLLIGGAFVFAFTDYMSDKLFGTRRTFLIIMFVAYAVYRGIRVYQALKQKQNEE